MVMASVVARTGRHRQRYDNNNLRLVSGCIPYRVAKHDDHHGDSEHKIEVLMISSPNRDDLVFPKGGWDDDETCEEAACREALEEAGVKGILKGNGNPLGVWEFRSKSSQKICSLKGGCKGYMFALEVTEELEVWPEQGNRDRKWLCIKEAFKLCRYEWMCRALEKFLAVMTEDRKHEMWEEVVVAPHPVPVSECQILLTNCCVKRPSGSQQHSNTSSCWDYAPSWHIAVSTDSS
ncbi:Nudix hydrolase [Actinidia chinensis var. chinensis]|uniref:Nudix hydrolase n=1 Tax=Actinidia chinensis var. chinensis TaxID=1590841 RepID=A0A2R6R0W9_ACTCC|nr:Nudix hydrolase [Actinidia chinensis var. chinensis]